MLDRYSWEQIGLMAECVLTDRFETLSMIVQPIVGGLGQDYTGPSVGKKQRKRTDNPRHRVHRAADFDSAEARDAALLGSLGRAGIRIRSVPASGEGGSAG